MLHFKYKGTHGVCANTLKRIYKTSRTKTCSDSLPAEVIKMREAVVRIPHCNTHFRAFLVVASTFPARVEVTLDIAIPSLGVVIGPWRGINSNLAPSFKWIEIVNHDGKG